MQPEILLTLVLASHTERHRRAAAEATANDHRAAIQTATEGRRETGRRLPRPPLGPLVGLVRRRQLAPRTRRA